MIHFLCLSYKLLLSKLKKNYIQIFNFLLTGFIRINIFYLINKLTSYIKFNEYKKF